MKWERRCCEERDESYLAWLKMSLLIWILTTISMIPPLQSSWRALSISGILQIRDNQIWRRNNENGRHDYVIRDDAVITDNQLLDMLTIQTAMTTTSPPFGFTR
jgi:hypothetical protein